VKPPLATNRRDVLKLGGAAVLAVFAPTGFTASAPARSAASMIALADPRYDQSLMFAESLRRHGAKTLMVAPDRARLWFDAIEPQLSTGLRYLVGLTHESDLFVLTRLAENSGVRTSYVGLHDWRCRHGSTHKLSGSIDLDLIATALVTGKDRWAENIGEAMALAKENGSEERRFDLDCAMDADHGPRFFVSWLMGWTA
jgi:hypothetical protein